MSTDNKTLIFGQECISNTVHEIAKVSEGQLFWFLECLEAYEEARGNIPGFPSLEALILTFEGTIKRLIALRDTLIAEVERDISATIGMSVNLRKKASIYPNIIPQNIDIKKDTDLAKKAEEMVVGRIGTVLDPQIEKVAGFLLRAEKLK